MPSPTPVNLTGLDFDQFKTSLKAFLSTQDQIKDFNYEGSVISVVLDLLSYDTTNNSFYLNMVGNEMFLDSATRRNSVVSHAKPIGYVPASTRSAFAKLALILIPAVSLAPGSAITIPAGTKWSSTLDQITYTFQTVGEYIVLPDVTGVYQVEVEIYEGVSLTYAYTVGDDVEYLIPNKGVDTSTMIVAVAPATSPDDPEYYEQATKFLGLDSDSKVYFVEETLGQKFRIYFGDGILSHAPVNGSIVKITYLVSSGTYPNGCALFQLEDSIADIDSISVQITTLGAAGGKDIESIESIRLNAPLYFETQNRAVTAEDYKRIIKRDYSFVDVVAAWGGQTAEPPQYGYVFICIKPVDGYQLDANTKLQIVNDLQSKYNVVSITPTIVDPSLVFLKPVITVYYDPVKTSLSAQGLQSVVTNAVVAYDDQYLGKFDTILRGSQFGTYVDASEPSILHNITKFNIGIPVTIDSNRSRSYSGTFGTSVASSSLKSSEFTYGATPNCFFFDDGVGNIAAGYQDGAVIKIVQAVAGTINYSTGVFNILSALLISQDGIVEITATNQSPDFYPIRNQIVEIRSSDIFVTALPESTIQTFSAGT